MAGQKQPIMLSHSWGKLLTWLEDLQEVVTAHAGRTGENLRREEAAASSLHVFAHTNPFRQQDEQYMGSQCLPLANAHPGQSQADGGGAGWCRH